MKKKLILVIGILIIGIILLLDNSIIPLTPSAIITVPIENIIDSCDNLYTIYTNIEGQTSKVYWEAGHAASNVQTNYINQIEGIGCLDLGKDKTNNNLFYYTKYFPNRDGTNKFFRVYVYIKDTNELRSTGRAMWVATGSSTTDYYIKEYTKIDLHNGWNLFGGDIDSLTKVGNPILTQLNRIYLFGATNSPDNIIPIGNIRMDVWSIDPYLPEDLCMGRISEHCERNINYTNANCNTYEGIVTWEQLPLNHCLDDYYYDCIDGNWISTYVLDSDNDGWNNTLECNSNNKIDCDDSNPNINPGANMFCDCDETTGNGITKGRKEICENDIDDDCDGEMDESDCEDVICTELGGVVCESTLNCIGEERITSGNTKCCIGQCGDIIISPTGETITLVYGECLDANEDGIGKRSVTKNGVLINDEECVILLEGKNVPFYSIFSLLLTLIILIQFYSKKTFKY